MTTIDFPSWLEIELGARGMKPADLSKLAKIDQAVISRILNRERNPAPDTLLAIAKALKLPPEEVFRKAGLLPPKPKTNIITEEITYLLAEMPEDRRQEALRYIRYLAEQSDQQRNISNQSTGVEPSIT